MPNLKLYVIAGPNGIGKTTSTFDLIPIGMPIINSDEITKQVAIAGITKVNSQEYANLEALKLMNEHIEAKVSFAIETNLADEETWKFIKGIRVKEYASHLIFMCTDDIDLLNSRIQERHERGEHFVRPDIVESRYHTALNLLSHYFDVPDNMQLIDNSDETLLALEKSGDKMEIRMDPLPTWVNNLLKAQVAKIKSEEKTSDLSIDEIRKKYQEKLKTRKE